MSFLQSIKAVDFYRKLKRDLQAELTEASIPGAALSVIAAIVMLGLIFAELRSFLTISAETKISLDHFDSSADDTLQIHLNKDGKATRKHEDKGKALKHTVDEVHEGPAASTLLTDDTFETAHHQHEV